MNDLQQALDHLIGSRHDAGVGRVGLLRDDQVAELRGNVDVRRFKRAADDGPGRTEDWVARFRRCRVSLAVERLERILTVERRQRNVGQRDSLAVRERTRYLTLGIDRKRLQLTGGRAVL